MAQKEKIGVSLSAVALVAGVLTGSSFRPNVISTAPKVETATPATPSRATAEIGSPLRHLRPAITLLGQALGLDLDPEREIAAASAVLSDLDKQAPPLSRPAPDLASVLKGWGSVPRKAEGKVKASHPANRWRRSSSARRAIPRSSRR